MDPFLIFKLCAVAAVGLALGSYFAALTYRLPRGVTGLRSACPSCGHGLAARDLVPVFSWLFLRGRCRYCAGRIGVRYTAIELATALGLTGFFWLVFEN